MKLVWFWFRNSLGGNSRQGLEEFRTTTLEYLLAGRQLCMLAKLPVENFGDPG